jgi:hypothetical protein
MSALDFETLFKVQKIWKEKLSRFYESGLYFSINLINWY